MEEADERYRGRVMSIYMMNFGLMPLGLLPAGLAVDWLGGQAVVAILSLLLFVTTAGIMATQGGLRRLE